MYTIPDAECQSMPDARPQLEGAFARHAHRYFAHGMAVLPTGGVDGKRPLIRGYGRRLLGPDEITRYSEKFAGANLAFRPAPSGLVVLDIDSSDASVQNGAIRRFGDTPVKVRTGSGNMQLYFRSKAPVTSLDLRPLEGVPIEVKGDGVICVAPPSTNPETGGEYRFIEGGLEDLARLPEIDMSSLEMPRKSTPEGRKIQVGLRNNTLFRQCLRDARHVDSIDELVDIALLYAEDNFIAPMTQREVMKTAASAWGYQLAGNNWSGRESRVPLPWSFAEQVCNDCGRIGSDALTLLIRLITAHSDRNKKGERFAIASVSMATAQTIPYWGRKRYEVTRDALVSAGYLECVRPGKGRGNPHLYTLTTKALDPGIEPAAWEPSRWI